MSHIFSHILPMVLLVSLSGCKLTHWERVCPDGTSVKRTTFEVDGEEIGKILSCIPLGNGLVQCTILNEDGTTSTRDIDEKQYNKAKKELDECIEEKLEDCDFDSMSTPEVMMSTEEGTKGRELDVEGQCCEFECEVSFGDSSSVRGAPSLVRVR